MRIYQTLEIWILPSGREERGGGGGMVSPRKSVVQSTCQYDVTSRVSDFQNGDKVFIEETDKNFDFITEIPFQFLGFGDFKVSIVIEN